jgi:hypothetical protein
MEPTCDAAAVPSTSTTNSRRFASTRYAREGMVSAWKQQCPRGCETAPDEAFYPGGRHPKRGSPARRGDRGLHGAGQDDRLRRRSHTHKRVASIPPWPCTARAERSNAGHPSVAPSKEAKFTFTGSHPSPRQCPSRVNRVALTACSSLPVYLASRHNRGPLACLKSAKKRHSNYAECLFIKPWHGSPDVEKLRRGAEDDSAL